MEKVLTHNSKRMDMRRRHLASAPIRRGDLVCVVPSRGEEFWGLVTDLYEHPLYGLHIDVLHAGLVRRYEAERVSR